MFHCENPCVGLHVRRKRRGDFGDDPMVRREKVEKRRSDTVSRSMDGCSLSDYGAQ